MEYSFRNCTLEDFDFLFKLKKENFKWYVDEIWGWKDKDQKERLKQDLKEHLNHKRIILVDDKPVGIYAVHTTQDGDLFINEISILKEYQNKGIGKKILEEQLKENHEILGEFTESFGIFFRKGLANPESSYFMNHIEFRPPYKEVIDIIHKAGGKAFLAHPFEYKFKDTIKFINDLRKEKELDGIECFHPSANQKQRNILADYAKNNNLYISGGSDYHGSPKPDIEIGVGRGDLSISKEILNWL